MTKEERGPQTPAAHRSEQQRPPEHLRGILDEVARLLDEGQPSRALEVIARSGQTSDWLANAKGVCQLRAGDAAAAVQTFRGLVVDGLYIRSDVPAVFVANFAAALISTSNFNGFLFALSGLDGRSHPSAARYWSEYLRWVEGLRPWQRLLRRHYSQQFRPKPPLGDLT